MSITSYHSEHSEPPTTEDELLFVKNFTPNPNNGTNISQSTLPESKRTTAGGRVLTPISPSRAGTSELDLFRHEIKNLVDDKDSVTQQELMNFVQYHIQRYNTTPDILKPLKTYSQSHCFSWPLFMESLENRGDEDLCSVFENALRQSEMPLQKLIECLKMITTRETVSRHEMVKCLRHSVEQCKIQLSIDDLLRPYDQDSVFAWSGFVNILDNLSRNTDPYEAINAALRKSKKHFVDQQFEWASRCTRSSIARLTSSVERDQSRHHRKLHKMCLEFLKDPFSDVFGVWENSEPSKDPIVDVGIVIGQKGNEKIANCEIIYLTAEGNTAALNTAGSGNVYIYLKRGTSRAPLTALSVYSLPEESAAQGFETIRHSTRGEEALLSLGLKGEDQYLATKRGDGPPIIDIQITSKKKRERILADYHQVSRSPIQRDILLDKGYTTITYRKDFAPRIMECKKFVDQYRASKDQVSELLARCVTCLVVGLYSFDREVFIKSLEAFTCLDQIREFPPDLLKFFIECVWNCQPCYLSHFKADTFTKLFKWLDHVFTKRLHGISPGSFICLIQVCTLFRQEDMRQKLCENMLNAVCKKVKSKRKREKRRKTAFEKQMKDRHTKDLASEGGDELPSPKNRTPKSIKKEVVAGCMEDLIDQVTGHSVIMPLKKLFTEKRDIDDHFRRAFEETLEANFEYHYDRLAIAAVCALSKIIDQDLPDTSGIDDTEPVKRRNWALRLLNKLLHVIHPFFNGEPLAGVFLRQIFGGAFLGSCITSHRTVIQNVSEITSNLWHHYQEIMKFEIGVYLEMGFVAMMESDYCSIDRKLELVEYVGNIFKAGGDQMVDLYYNYDNELDQPICTSLMRALAELVVNSKGELVLKSLKQLSRFLEQIATFLDVPGLEDLDEVSQPKHFRDISMMKSNDNLREESETSRMGTLTMSRFVDLNPHAESPHGREVGVFALDDDDNFNTMFGGSQYDLSLRFSKRPMLQRRTSWDTRNDARAKQKQIVEDAILISRAEALKKGIKHLVTNGGERWGSITGVATFLFEYKDQLPQGQVTEFLGRRKSSVYTVEQHKQLREAWSNFIDVTNMDFEKAWRHYLMDCGVLLADQEAATVETLLELFAAIYVRNNPGIFRDDTPAFQLTFALFMVQSEQTKSAVKSTFTQGSFIDMMRAAECPLSDELLARYFNNIRKNPLEFGTAEQINNSNQLAMNEQFHHECIRMRSRARARLFRFAHETRSFRHCSDKMVVRGLYNACWEHFLAPLTLQIQLAETAEVLAAALDAIKFASATLVRLRMNQEADSFISQVSELYYRQSNDTLEPRELDKHILGGRHRSSEVFLELHRLMELENDDYASSCNYIVRIVNSVKSRILYEDRQKKLAELEEQLQGKVHIRTPERKFIEMGFLKKLAGNRKLLERMVLLFNDCIIYGERKGDEVKLHRTIHLSLCSVIEIKDNYFANVRHCFKVDSPQKPIILVCSSQEEKNHWRKVVRDAIKECLRDREKWIVQNVPDNTDPAKAKAMYIMRKVEPMEFEIRRKDPILKRPKPCNLCCRPYSFWNSKTRCPQCRGEICQSHCFSKRVRVGKKMQKVCDACAGLLRGADGNARLGKFVEKPGKPQSTRPPNA